VGKLRPNIVPEKPWQYILVSFIMKLLISRDHDLILVCDRFLKMLYFIVTTEKIIAERLVKLFRDNVRKLHRLPESVILDRRPVRRGSHQGGSLQDRLGDERTCGTTLASAYTLHCLSAA